MTSQELQEILKKHEMWLKGQEGGVRADLHNVDLSYADLTNADLTNVDLSYANLSNANLTYADLTNADLACVNLSNADLFYTDLSYADLWGANLTNADLTNANLWNTNLSNTDLRNVDLSSTELYNVDLSYANLYGANLHNVDLTYANLYGTKLDKGEERRKGIILKEPKIAFKCCGEYVVQLEIPKGAIVFSINNDACRANKAKPIAILNADKTISNRKSVASEYDSSFIYKLMKEIEIQDFDLMYNVQNTTGIHFFWSFERARDFIGKKGR